MGRRALIVMIAAMVMASWPGLALAFDETVPSPNYTDIS